MADFPDYKIINTSSLVPYARNSRTHSAEQIAQIAASIKEFGFLNPIIVDGDSGIIAVHGRVLAAQKLGLAELPVIEAGHLSDTQRRAYIIADNKLALNAGWDYESLQLELGDLAELDFDISLIGFDDDELQSGDDTIGVADDKILDYLESPLKTLTVSIPSAKYDEIYDRLESHQSKNGLSSISEAVIDMVMS
jgi:hypothetical protein